MEIRTEVEIEAPLDTVWRALIDFAEYPAWNPFIKEITGEPSEGSRLSVTMQPPGGKTMTFKPVVTRVVENSEFRWQGRLLLPGIFDGEHIFELEETTERKTNFVHREKFGGVLVPLLRKSLQSSTKQGFVDFNEALKARCESVWGQTRVTD